MIRIEELNANWWIHNHRDFKHGIVTWFTTVQLMKFPK